MWVDRIGERKILLTAEDLEVDRRRERQQLIAQAGNRISQPIPANSVSFQIGSKNLVWVAT